MIRVDCLQLDMRAGPRSPLTCLVAVSRAGRPHQTRLFAKRRANRMKVLGQDEGGVSLL